MNSHLSDLALHRLIAGERTDKSTLEHVDGCASCRARMDAVVAAHNEFASDAALPARLAALADAAARVPAKSSWRHWHKRTLGIAGVALAAVMIFAVGVRGSQDADSPSGIDPTIRRKGKANDALEIFHRDAAGHVSTLSNRSKVRPGDAISFRVTVARRGFIGIVGIDAAHTIAAYAPLGEALEEMPAGMTRLLDGSIVLDDTLGAERVVLVVCDKARRVAELVEEARAALQRAGGDVRAMGATSSCREVSYLLEKVP